MQPTSNDMGVSDNGQWGIDPQFMAINIIGKMILNQWMEWCFARNFHTKKCPP